MVRRDGQGPRALPLLQGRQSRSPGDRLDDPCAPKVDIDRIMAELDRLASKSDAPAPAVTRVVYTDADLAGAGLPQGPVRGSRAVGSRGPDRQHVRALGGARARPGAGGNGLAHRRDSALRPLRRHGRSAWAGSRRFALCVARASSPLRPIELLMFTSEEPTRFGIGCLGSRASVRQPCRRSRSWHAA